MSEKDTLTKEYMANPVYFADAFNYFMFNGKQIIKPEKLSAEDPTELAIIFNENAKETEQKVRDVLKNCVVKHDDKAYYLILGIENQSEVHYAMSVKNMIYDALNYGKQVSNISRMHRKNKEYGSNAEFLSGLKKNDRLKPVITLTIYFGADEWDAARSLKEMFGDVDERILNYVSDYKLNLIIPKEISDYDKFQTDFKALLKSIAISDDVNEYKKISEDVIFKSVKTETVNVINKLLGEGFKIEENAEVIDMCEAARKLREMDKEEGRIQGVEQGVNKIIGTMLKKGKTAEEVSQLTDVDLEIVKELKKVMDSK